MALPSGEANKELIDEVSGLSDVINRLLFKTDNIRSDMNANLFAIKINSDAMAHSLSTLEAMAELEFERMDDGDAEKEDVDLESPDAEKLGEGGPTIELLTKIAEATRETAESTKVLADAAREESENVLDPPDGQSPPNIPTSPDGTPKADSKKDRGIMGALAAILGGVLGTIAGLFTGWLKALKFIFYRGFIAKIGNIFTGFFKGLKTQFKGGALAKGFAKVGNFFKTIGSFFGRIFKIFGTIFGFIKNVVSIAGKVAGVVSKIFAPLLVIFGIFETIKGFFSGFANTEGSFMEKLMGGLAGALTGFLDFLIAAPLNLIKGIIGWIAGALGFDGVKEKLESFDFSFGGIVNAVFDVIKFVAGVAFKILKFPVALAAGIAGGIAALLPGGKSPKEGFMDAFNAVMNFGSGEQKPPIPGEGDGGEADAMSEGAPTNDDAAKEQMDTRSVPESGQGEVNRENIYPFKLKGFKETGLDEDEYIVMGENPAGGYYLHPTDGDIKHYRMFQTRKKPAVNSLIDSAVDTAVGSSAALSMGFGGADVSAADELAAIQSRSGVTLTDRQAELEAKRAGYGSSGSSTVVTNVGGTSSSSTTTQVVVKPQAPAETRKGTGAAGVAGAYLPM